MEYHSYHKTFHGIQCTFNPSIHGNGYSGSERLTLPFAEWKITMEVYIGWKFKTEVELNRPTKTNMESSLATDLVAETTCISAGDLANGYTCLPQVPV